MAITANHRVQVLLCVARRDLEVHWVSQCFKDCCPSWLAHWLIKPWLKDSLPTRVVTIVFALVVGKRVVYYASHMP